MSNNTLNPPREGSKLALLIQSTKGKGASLEVLSDQLGWQPHTVRAAITRLRQRGFSIACKKPKKAGVSIYQLSKPPA